MSDTPKLKRWQIIAVFLVLIALWDGLHPSKETVAATTMPCGAR